MRRLQQMFPSLSIFSDLDWDAVTQEYETTSIDLSFPEYLQQKAAQGDCPPYLFEIAYFEMATFNARTSPEPLPFRPGVYLNPTAMFLALEYDVAKMLREASLGRVEVYEKPHVLCLYRDANDKINSVELDNKGLLLLKHLEDGPKSDKSFVEEHFHDHYKEFVEKGIILDLSTDEN
jgi:hypothetical protein